MSHHIGIDYTAALEQRGGIGRYVRELTRALGNLDKANLYHLFGAGVTSQQDLPSIGSNFYWHATRLTPRFYARLWHRLQVPLPIETWTGSLDLFHAPDFTLPPVRKGTKKVLTVHDLSFMTHPETAHPALKRFLDTAVPRSIDRADLVLADSMATRNDLVDLLGTSSEKIEVLYSGVESRFTRITDINALKSVFERYNIPPEPFILSVGTLSPRKNFTALVRALAVSDLPHHLVIAGGKGWQTDPLYQVIDELSMQDRVTVTGFVSEADLPALYSAADIFALVSLYEGFGLPLLEAMACGTPIVTSGVSSLPEVAGEAALYVDPLDSDQIAGALVLLANTPSLKEKLVKQGMIQKEKFSWENAASELHQYYLNLIES